MADLTTTYLDLQLKNPLIASASPLSEKVETVCALEESGIAALVMYSLFEEQIIHESLELDHYLDYGTQSFAEALTYLPNIGRYSIGPESYLQHLRRVKKAVTIPVIGSLNGVSTGGWIDYARMIEDAGADALELNIYYLSFDPKISSAELEATYANLVSNVKAKINIPLAVKISPFFTGMANVCQRLVEAGADGLVLFNRFYQPDFDLEELEIVPNLSLSTSQELRMPLRWISLLYGRIQTDFALTTGIHTAEDVLKAMMAGANVAMMASELLAHGPGRAAEILNDIEHWMTDHEYESIQQMRGSMSAQAMHEPHALRRSNYIKVLNSFKYLP
ncbi:MAG: dihydroorotate dehydrogenase-like protein [Anaerolineales bacterium]|nr:dihydroorotate dehydrogenase-like protein [Anaerolineales bacterium]MDO9349080.1 dihydroorotate dehydrogenase-like protein [Anaerolineales bacterium]MDP3184114.1 dihydroorotate dehydrogenase-like protein [Anaerolineales bacterium]